MEVRAKCRQVVEARSAQVENKGQVEQPPQLGRRGLLCAFQRSARPSRRSCAFRRCITATFRNLSRSDDGFALILRFAVGARGLKKGGGRSQWRPWLVRIQECCEGDSGFRSFGMANVWCVQNGVQRLEGGAFGRSGKVGLAIAGRRSFRFVSTRGIRRWSELGLRVVAAARPTDVEAGNVEWLDLSKQGEADGGEDALRRRERERTEEQAGQNAGPQGSATLGLPAQSDSDLRRREQQFASILQVPKEERDKVQKLHVLTRAAAALAAVDALLASNPARKPLPKPENPAPSTTGTPQWVTTSTVEVRVPALQQRPLSAEDLPGATSGAGSTLGTKATPGPDFWTWVPPPDDRSLEDMLTPKMQRNVNTPKPLPKFSEEENIDLPLEREFKELPLVFQSRSAPSLPPLQSLLEVEKEKGGDQEVQDTPSLQIPESVTETVSAMKQGMQTAGQDSDTSGVHADGSRWWKEQGVENRANGVICTWTVIRGVSADGSVEWEEKFWEAADAYDFKELGAEKSGRNSAGGVWREFWQESMWQDATTGLMHMQKSADKWAKNGHGGQWHEKWMEHYDASGRAEKWADKWSQIDPNTPLDPGHAHVWHERWGEDYDGQGASMKYTDKWAERSEHGGGWTKWGDKWDERFDQQGHGVKQGETWWEGTQGERWNRTWGEGHNGSGWVHKYGQSSSGEHWDTHQQEATWYDRHPHFGFRECFENSRELRRVGKKRRRQL